MSEDTRKEGENLPENEDAKIQEAAGHEDSGPEETQTAPATTEDDAEQSSAGLPDDADAGEASPKHKAEDAQAWLSTLRESARQRQEQGAEPGWRSRLRGVWDAFAGRNEAEEPAESGEAEKPAEHEAEEPAKHEKPEEPAERDQAEKPAEGGEREGYRKRLSSLRETIRERWSREGTGWRDRLLALVDKYNLKNPKQWPGGLWAALAMVVLVIVVAVAGGGRGGNTVPTAAPAVENMAVDTSIRVSYQREYIENGTFELTGLADYSEEEIEENLSFSPDVRFEVEKQADGVVVVTIPNHRNIGLTGSFRTGRAGDAGRRTVTFEVNDPALSVRIGGTASLTKHQSLQLVFSEQVDIYSLEENLTIEPRTAYTLSYDLNNVTIVPDVEWIITDNYQITISAAYASKTGKGFGETQVLSFKVREPYVAVTETKPSITFETASSFVLDEATEMYISFNASRLKDNVPVLVETYRMDSLEKYRDQGTIYLDYDIKLDSLEKLDTNAFLIKNGDNRFAVPSFGEGAYILSATYTDPNTEEEREKRTSFFVTGMNVYMQTSARETLVWLNNSESGPLADYTVTFADKTMPMGATDQDGLLIVPHMGEEGRNPSPTSFSITDPDGALVYYDDTSLYAEYNHSERYYSYLFLDRTLYRPEDTVCFWGFVKPFRYNELDMPDTVTVVFDAGGLDLKVEAELAESGVYYGEIELERVKSTQYSVQAELYFPPEEENGTGTRRVLETEYVSVKEFEKPTFVLSSETDKDYYGPDDMVTVTVTASFYDGTPLPMYPLEVAYHDLYNYTKVDIKDIVTDASGTATFSFPAVSGGSSLGSDKSLRTGQYMVQIANDGEQVSRVGYYRHFPSDTLVDTVIERQPDNENLQLTVRAYKLNMDSPQLRSALSGSSDGYYYGFDNSRLLELARGEAVDVELEIGLHWNYTDMRRIRHRNSQSSQSNTYVKFQNSYSLDVQEPDRIMEVIKDWETSEKRISVETENGVAVVRDLIYLPEEGAIDFGETVNVRASLGYNDGKNNRCTSSVYYPRGVDWSYDYEEREPEPVPGYSFSITATADGADLTPASQYYRYVNMSVGQQAQFQLLLDGEPVETEGRILYSILQDGLYEHRLIAGDTFNLDYKLDYGRDVRMVSVYFDGQKTHYIKQLDLEASTASLGVTVDVTPDRESYRPGENVTLQVNATDSEGRGVAGNLCVAVVDESIFALSEQYVNVLYGLYSNLTGLDNYVSQYCTTYRDTEPPASMWDGGKGDGYGADFYDSYRSNFKDTALFFPTTTNAAGNSTITFTLPDNTTSWRITAVEIAGDLRAGYSKSNIISTLPFFCKPVMTSKYIDGDDVSLLVQGHGTLLEQDSPINYTVTLTGDGISETLTGAGVAYEALEFNFGKLPIGTYTVVARAQFSGYADTVELPLSVIKSNLELVVNKPIDITDTLDINAMRYPVTLTMYDKSNEAFLTSINSLFSHYCMQANQRMSRFVAKRVIRQTVEGGGNIPYYIADGNDYASDMQNDDGGIGYMRGRASEPVLTTYVLLIAKDQFNLNAMTSYYRSQLAKTSLSDKDRAACYLGLAAIGNTTADEILDALDKNGIATDVQAYLVAALAYLGETDQAGDLYDTLLADQVPQINNGVKKSVEWDRNAAAIWIAASKLGHNDADELSIYFGSARWRYRTLFECMIYVTNYDRRVTTSSFSYTMKGQSHTVDLGLSGMKTLVLSKSDLETLQFTSYDDTLKAYAYYVGEPEELGLEQSENMDIQKSVRSLSDNTYEVTLSIHLGDEAPTGQYDISDWVPSNSRLYSYDKSYKIGTDTIYFDVTDEGQKLYMAFDNNVAADRTILFRYKIRQTYQSEAMLDTTYMIHGDSGENCNTEKEVFKPTPTGDSVQVIKLGEEPQPAVNESATTTDTSEPEEAGQSAESQSDEQPEEAD